jgi:hypothetical protein
MGQAVANHLQPGKFLFAFRAFEVSGGAVFDNALHQTFHQPAATAFVILVQQRLTLGTVNGNGPNIAFRHDVTYSTMM